MDRLAIESFFRSLPEPDQNSLLSSLTNIKTDKDFQLLDIRETQFNEKQGVCPHCNNIKYVKMGKDKGVQRYKCKSCSKTFTPYTGTWMAHIHHKDKLATYLKLMGQGLSLDKTCVKLCINKKTAFDWRHKIINSIKDVEHSKFIGITESDETFFLRSNKGSENLVRKPRNRGKQIKTRGISKEQVAVIVSTDRKGSISLDSAGLGRMSKGSIEKSIGNKINEQTILCTDGLVSYKGFALDNKLEHHILRADLKQFVKQGKYHIQHVNSLHSRLKKWINKDLYGVATKYLQNYLNWFRFQEKFKTQNYVKKIIVASLTNTKARDQYLYAVQNIYKKNNAFLN